MRGRLAPQHEPWDPGLLKPCFSMLQQSIMGMNKLLYWEVRTLPLASSRGPGGTSSTYTSRNAVQRPAHPGNPCESEIAV
jgi:hypothetical protein